MARKQQFTFTNPRDSFDSWAADSVELLQEVEQQLVGLTALMRKEGFREDAEARRLAAALKRHQRVSRLLRQQIDTTRAHARKYAALKRLGRTKEDR